MLFKLLFLCWAPRQVRPHMSPLRGNIYFPRTPWMSAPWVFEARCLRSLSLQFRSQKLGDYCGAQTPHSSRKSIGLVRFLPTVCHYAGTGGGVHFLYVCVHTCMHVYICNTMCLQLLSVSMYSFYFM